MCDVALTLEAKDTFPLVMDTNLFYYKYAGKYYFGFTDVDNNKTTALRVYDEEKGDDYIFEQWKKYPNYDEYYIPKLGEHVLGCLV